MTQNKTEEAATTGMLAMLQLLQEQRVRNRDLFWEGEEQWREADWFPSVQQELPAM
jgi:hypothetical protein